MCPLPHACRENQVKRTFSTRLGITLTLDLLFAQAVVFFPQSFEFSVFTLPLRQGCEPYRLGSFVHRKHPDQVGAAGGLGMA